MEKRKVVQRMKTANKFDRVKQYGLDLQERRLSSLCVFFFSSSVLGGAWDCFNGWKRCGSIQNPPRLSLQHQPSPAPKRPNGSLRWIRGAASVLCPLPIDSSFYAKRSVHYGIRTASSPPPDPRPNVHSEARCDMFGLGSVAMFPQCKSPSGHKL